MEGKEISEERFIECLAIDFPNFKITKSNLTHPTSQFVISFYALILRHAMELNDPEKIWNLTEDQRAYMKGNPEAATFSQHVWTNNLHAVVKYVFSHLSQNGTEFVYSDILYPEITPRRSFVFMALMLNFYWYTNDFALGLDENMSACVEEGMLIRNLKTEKERLIDQLREMEDQRSHYAESFKEIKAYMKKCADSNDELENVMKDLVSENDGIQQEVQKLSEEEQKLQEDLTKLQNEKKYLESLIVSNPNQVTEIYQKHLTKKEECVKKMKTLEEHAKQASSKVLRNTNVLELQQKLNYHLRDEKYMESQGKHRGFESLYENINILLEKKKKLLEEESGVVSAVTEAEEMVQRKNNECQQCDSEQQKIHANGKDKTSVIADVIDNQKKTYSQLFIQMRKSSEEVEEFASTSLQVNGSCEEIQERIENYETENKEKYVNYVKTMRAALNSIQGVFGQDKSFF